MGVRYPTAGSSTRLTNTIVTTAETLIVTTQPLNLTIDFAQVLLWWYVALTIGTGGTTLTILLRRGTLVTSSLINIGAGITVVAGNSFNPSGCYVDTPGAVAGQQYSMSATVSGASANSTVTDAAMIAMAL